MCSSISFQVWGTFRCPQRNWCPGRAVIFPKPRLSKWFPEFVSFPRNFPTQMCLLCCRRLSLQWSLEENWRKNQSQRIESPLVFWRTGTKEKGWDMRQSAWALGYEGPSGCHPSRWKQKTVFLMLTSPRGALGGQTSLGLCPRARRLFTPLCVHSGGCFWPPRTRARTLPSLSFSSSTCVNCHTIGDLPALQGKGDICLCLGHSVSAWS